MKKVFVFFLPLLTIAVVYKQSCSQYKPSTLITDYSVEINSLNTYYRTAGDSKNEALVFTPGWGARNASDCMPGNDPVIDQLAKHFYVIMFEPPGLIRSEPPREIWSFDDYAHHLNKLVNELEIKNSYFMGQSFGGGVSTAYAKLYPDNVKTLILVDSTMANRTRNWYYNLRFPWNAFVKKAIPSRFVPFAIKRLIVSGYFGVPLAEIGKDNLTYWITVAEIQQAHDLEVDYTSLQMPVLMIWGNKDTYVTSIDHARKTHSLIPNSTFVEVDGGHTVLFKNPEIVVNKIKENL